jgi:hypothetical protein
VLCLRRVNAANERAEQVALLVQHPESVTNDTLRPRVDGSYRGPRIRDDSDFDVESRWTPKPSFHKNTERVGTNQMDIAERPMPRVVLQPSLGLLYEDDQIDIGIDARLTLASEPARPTAMIVGSRRAHAMARSRTHCTSWRRACQPSFTTPRLAD